MECCPQRWAAGGVVVLVELDRVDLETDTAAPGVCDFSVGDAKFYGSGSV